jgi:YD repeat-containing protein
VRSIFHCFLSRRRWLEEHTFDPVGNPGTYRTRAGQVQTSTFDNRNREVSRSWSDSTPGVAKSYDLAGRLTSCQTVGVVTCSYTYDVAGQLLTETHTPAALGTPFTLTYTYDLNGNRASLVYPGGTVVEYSHKARNQVTSVTANGSPALATYAYDALGNRTTKTLENGTTTSGSVYYHHDGLGSTVVLTDAAGAKIESYTYDVFGTVSFFDAAGFPQASSTAGNRFLYTGRDHRRLGSLGGRCRTSGTRRARRAGANESIDHRTQPLRLPQPVVFG